MLFISNLSEIYFGVYEMLTLPPFTQFQEVLKSGDTFNHVMQLVNHGVRTKKIKVTFIVPSHVQKI